MKQTILLASALFFMAAACTSNSRRENKGEADADSLKKVIERQDKLTDDYIKSFTYIHANLDSIGAKQQNIILKIERPGENIVNIKDAIGPEISAINTLMEDNRKEITHLNKILKEMKSENTELKKSIRSLNEQLAVKEDQLKQLDNALVGKNIRVAALQTSVIMLGVENVVLESVAVSEDEQLHTAYYIVGTSKELREKKLIDKKGGLLGIGRTAGLSNDPDESEFIKTDYRKLERIPVYSKHAHIITTHPVQSYYMEKDAKRGDIKNIVITNAEKFWSVSKYLVVVKDEDVN